MRACMHVCVKPAVLHLFGILCSLLNSQGPVLRVWFISLDRLFGPTRVAGDAVKKVLLDQLIFAPVLTAALLTLFSFSRGMDSSQVKEKLKEVRLVWGVVWGVVWAGLLLSFQGDAVFFRHVC